MLPVVWDSYTTLVVRLVNTPFFGGFAGALDGNGRAAATFDPHGLLPPAMVGLTMSYAYTLQGYRFVSNPVNVAIEP